MLTYIYRHICCVVITGIIIVVAVLRYDFCDFVPRHVFDCGIVLFYYPVFGSLYFCSIICYFCYF
jgi:hypothetical protein